MPPPAPSRKPLWWVYLKSQSLFSSMGALLHVCGNLGAVLYTISPRCSCFCCCCWSHFSVFNGFDNFIPVCNIWSFSSYPPPASCLLFMLALFRPILLSDQHQVEECGVSAFYVDINCMRIFFFTRNSPDNSTRKLFVPLKSHRSKIEELSSKTLFKTSYY